MGTRAETTRKEKAILKFIEEQVIENGYPPSVREIGKAIGLSSTATVHAYLAKLEKQGFIKKEDKKGRTLKVIKGTDGQPLKKENKNFYAQREMVDVPVIGSFFPTWFTMVMLAEPSSTFVVNVLSSDLLKPL